MDTKKRAKKGKREQTLYPALNPGVNPRIRWEELADIDYIHKLNDEEKAWLNKFMDETVNASFNKDNDENLIKDEKEQKKIYQKNYQRQKDAYTRSKANGRIKDLDSVTETYDNEDELNFQIEIKRRNSKFMKKLKKEL